jgi:hypothetical protein
VAEVNIRKGEFVMAIGDNGSVEATGKSNREYSYYPRLRVKKDGSNKALNFEFKSGLLQIKIVESDGQYGFNQDPNEIIYLSPTKAMILSNELEKFIEYVKAGKIDENKGFGVNGGMGEKITYIAFHAKKDKTICITIGKFDGQGKIIESDTVELNKEYHYGLEWNNVTNMDVERVFDDNIEIRQILNLVKDFSRYMNGAAAYAHADLVRYDLGRVLGKMDPIYDKLGIERLTGSNGGNRGTNNFLNNAGKSQSKSLDDILAGDDLD